MDTEEVLEEGDWVLAILRYHALGAGSGVLLERLSPSRHSRAKTEQPKEERQGQCSARPCRDDAGMRRFAAG